VLGCSGLFFFFFNDTATTEIYTLSLHDALPICSASNGGDVAIPDLGAAVTSSNWILGCDRAPSTTATVAVDIAHSFRGDLLIDLVAPDGTAYRLKKASPYDSAANVSATYTVNLAGESANGDWRLKVQDLFAGDAGTIGGWTLTL